MEQHPVPRNISGFQFHLIGDMTLRQFGYLAAGVFIGYLIYKGAPFSTIINIPLALLCGFVGFAFAFLPIQERPLEKWIAAFIKSIMAPTQYVWFKNNPSPDILTRNLALHMQAVQPYHPNASHKETNEKLRAYLATIPLPLHDQINAAEKRYIEKTLALFGASSVVTTSYPPPIPPLNPPVSISPIAVEKKTEPIRETPQESPSQTPAAKSITQEKPLVKEEDHNHFKTQLSLLSAEKEALEKQLRELREQFKKSVAPEILQPEASQAQNEPTIKVVSPKSAAIEIGVLNYQQAANLISGVIKDPQRKLLPNIILTIKDKSGLPVRALKTNKLGQFTTATPLSNGTYLLEVEDPLKRYVFDVAQIALSGKVFLPIEIIAKGEKELMRERLAKELFGSPIV